MTSVHKSLSNLLDGQKNLKHQKPYKFNFIEGEQACFNLFYPVCLSVCLSVNSVVS